MNVRLAFRRYASFAFAIALFALTASSSFAQGPRFIIIVGG
jgi:hypothetical protein